MISSCWSLLTITSYIGPQRFGNQKIDWHLAWRNKWKKFEHWFWVTWYGNVEKIGEGEWAQNQENPAQSRVQSQIKVKSKVKFQNKTKHMVLFRSNGLPHCGSAAVGLCAAGAAWGAAHCALLQTMDLSAHTVCGSAPAQLCSNRIFTFRFLPLLKTALWFTRVH